MHSHKYAVRFGLVSLEGEQSRMDYSKHIITCESSLLLCFLCIFCISLLYNFFSAFGTSALLDPGSGSGVGVGSGFRIRFRVWIHQPGWIRTRSGAGSESGSGQEALLTDIPFICGIFYGGPDSDPDPCPGAGSGSGSAGPIWFGSGPGLGRVRICTWIRI
jgi:hypothetical protein